MLFNSIHFLLFFPIVLLVYYAIPVSKRYIWLLVTSYYFYMCWNPLYSILILLSTALTYACGRLLSVVKDKIADETLRKRRMGIFIGVCIITNLGILFYFKYTNFIIQSLNELLETLHIQKIPQLDILLPVGISFYTFQAIGYIIDVYRGDIEAEKNFLKYALFVSFFPQLVAGPIERSGNLLKQLDCKASFDYSRAVSGFRLMLWGFFEKIVIADKIAILVDTVYNDLEGFHGSVILFATILFALQIYCDFGGYSHIAIGAARVLGIELMENFRQPYFALNIKEFWNRWHISLSTWFRDYLYFPLGGSRCSAIKKSRNLLLTFLISGLWHGADWSYVIWGLLHGIYRVFGETTANLRLKLTELLRVKRDCFSFRLIQGGITFLLVDFAWIFFRANNSMDAFLASYKVLFKFHPSSLLSEVFFQMGLTATEYLFLLMAVAILAAVDYSKERGKKLQLMLDKQNLYFRWLAYYGLTIFILISLAQTYGKDAGAFIYFQF